MTDQQNALLARRGMYLAAYDQTIDAGSFCANFLIAIFDSLEFGVPTQIDITSTGRYMALTAVGCRLAIQPGQGQFVSSLFDIANHQQHLDQETYPSLAFLQPIVWLSEYCLIDIATPTTSYQQAFLHGSPSTQALERPSDDEPPRISFCLTLPADPFSHVALQIRRLKRVVALWQEKDFLRALPEKKKTLNLYFQWRRQADDYFSLRITPRSAATLAPPLDKPLLRLHKQSPAKVIATG